MAWCDGMEEPRLLISPLQTISAAEDKTTMANAEGCILSLRHPKSGASTSYVFKDGFLQELHWFKQSYGSWFLGDYVCEDGSFYITTPVDPIFIFLPIFGDARLKKGNDQGMFRQLDEILYVEGFSGYQCLMSMAEDSMRLVCEVRDQVHPQFGFCSQFSQKLVLQSFSGLTIPRFYPGCAIRMISRTEAMPSFVHDSSNNTIVGSQADVTSVLDSAIDGILILNNFEYYMCST